MIAEQDRIGLQIQETYDIINDHYQAIRDIESRLTRIDSERLALGAELDFQTDSYISDNASSLTTQAARRAEIKSNIGRLEDYLALYARLDLAYGELSKMEARVEEIDGALEQAKRTHSDFRYRMSDIHQYL